MIPLIFNTAERLVQIVIHTPSYYISYTILAAVLQFGPTPKLIYANKLDFRIGVWSQKQFAQKNLLSWCEPHPHRQ